MAAFALAIAMAAVTFAIRAIGGGGSQPAPETPPQPIEPKANGLIYFQLGGGDGGTWTDAIQPDGSGRTTIFGRNRYVSHIAWSPDGTKIAYVGIVQYGNQSPDGQAHFGIFVANPDGSGAQPLTDGVNEGWPTWSPDGTQIAFSSSRADPSVRECASGTQRSCPTDIYLMNADGLAITRLTDDPAPEYAPAWSPDGSRIAFVRTTGDTNEIDVMNADGTGVTQVASGTIAGLGGVEHPFSWSPDGLQIVFMSVAGANSEIHIVNADGTGERRIFGADGVVSEDPIWSPDGTEIAFSSTFGVYPPGCGAESDVCSDLFVMRADGSHVTRLTQGSHGVFGIAWQPLPVSSPSPPIGTSVSARVTDRIDVGKTAGSVAAADGSVWVATYDFDRGSAAVVHVDASTGQILARIPIHGLAYNVAAGDGAAWVTVDEPHGGSSLVRIGERTDRVTATVAGVSGPVVVDATGVWAVEGTNVVRIDPDTLAIEAWIPVGGSPLSVAAGGGAVWVLERQVQSDNVGPGPLVEVDAATATVSWTVDLSIAGGITAAEDGVWVSAWRPNDPHTAAAFFVPASGSPPEDAASVYNFRPFVVAEGRVWFISGPNDPGLPKGGICGLNVLTHVVDACAEPRSIVDLELAHDPAAYDPVTHTLWVAESESSFLTRIDVVQSSSASRSS